MTATLTLGDAARIVREAMRDKTYELTPLGEDVAAYLRWKRKSCAQNTLEAYESTLACFALHFADLELRDFEPPVGAERIEEFLHKKWGDAKATTYNRHRAALADFFKQHRRRKRMYGNPMEVVDPAKEEPYFREAFSEDHTRLIIESAEVVRDRLCLRLLLHYGLRRDGLRSVQFKHFDHARHRLAVFLKGGKVRYLRIPERAFWHDLERHILDSEARPNHYLIYAKPGTRNSHPDRPMSPHGLHKWWYRMLAQAGIVPEGTTSGERMHKARHSAGQFILDKTGNLSAAQSLLMHESIQTTGDIYTDWDDERLAVTLAEIYGEAEE